MCRTAKDVEKERARIELVYQEVKKQSSEELLDWFNWRTHGCGSSDCLVCRTTIATIRELAQRLGINNFVSRLEQLQTTELW